MQSQFEDYSFSNLKQKTIDLDLTYYSLVKVDPHVAELLLLAKEWMRRAEGASVAVKEALDG